MAAFIDAEHAFDRFYAEKLGVKTDDLLISQPSSGEEALEIAEQLIRSSAVDIIVIDSVAALTPKKKRSKEKWGGLQRGGASGTSDVTGAQEAYCRNKQNKHHLHFY